MRNGMVAGIIVYLLVTFATLEPNENFFVKVKTEITDVAVYLVDFYDGVIGEYKDELSDLDGKIKMPNPKDYNINNINEDDLDEEEIQKTIEEIQENMEKGVGADE